MQRGLSSNIWKYTIYLVANKRIYISILAVYLLATVDNSTAKDIGFMLLLGSIAGFIIEVPSGYLADIVGHKKTLILSRVLLVLSSLFYLLGDKLWFFFLGQILLSAGDAFHSGTGVAFMHETLRALNRETEYSKIMSKIRSIGFAIPIGFIVLIPFLTKINFRLPFAIGLTLDVVGLLAALSFVVPRGVYVKIKEISHAHIKEIFSEGMASGFFKYSFLIVLPGSLAFAVGGFKDAYQSVVGIPIIYYGVFFGASRVLISLFLFFSHRIKGVLSARFFILSQIVVMTGLVLTLGLAGKPWIIVLAFMFVSAVWLGFSEVTNDYSLGLIRQSRFKATLLSVKGLMSIVVRGVIGFILGVMIVRFSYEAAFIALAVSFFILALALFVLIIGKNEEAAESALAE